MTDLESFVGFIFAVIAVVTWARWYSDIFRMNRLAAPKGYRLWLGVVPVVCLFLVLLCLEWLAAKDVRESAFYILIYLIIGAGSLGISGQFFALLGISARDDVLERKNKAALMVTVGGLFGASLCYAGGNIGEGPGVEAVLASAGTALGIWLLLWYLLEILSGRRIAEGVTVERDSGVAIRVGALLVANGLVLGAAAAGDWIPNSFLHDFAISTGPACAITGVAAVVERSWRRPGAFTPSILIALGYLVAGALVAVREGLT